MDALQYLFGFKGRIGRLPMWIFAIVCLASVEGINALLDAVTPIIMPLQDGLTSAALVVIAPVVIWIGLALSAKRIHDRGWSASWLLLFGAASTVTLLLAPHLGSVSYAVLWATGSFWALMVPIGIVLIDILAFIELLCLPGTPGSNRFGPHPSFDQSAGPDLGNA